MIEKLSQAKRAYTEKKYEEAQSLFDEVISNDPSIFVAYAYKGFCLAYKTKLGEPHHVELVSYIKNGYDELRKLKEKPENYTSDSLEVVNELYKFVSYCIKLYSNKFNFEYNEYLKNTKKINDYDKSSGDQSNKKFVTESLNKIEEKYKKEELDYNTGINLTGVAYNTCMDIILYDAIKLNDDSFSLDNYKAILAVTKGIYSKFIDAKMNSQTLEKVKAFYDFCNNKVNHIETGKREEYWEEHKDEKTDIENKIKQAREDIGNKEKEITELEDNKKKLTLNLSESPSYLHQQEKIRELAKVNDTLNKLGAFDIKTRKRLTEEKSKLEIAVKGLGDNVKREKEAVENKFKSEKKAIDDKINQLHNDIINLKRDISNNEKILNQNR